MLIRKNRYALVGLACETYKALVEGCARPARNKTRRFPPPCYPRKGRYKIKILGNPASTKFSGKPLRYPSSEVIGGRVRCHQTPYLKTIVAITGIQRP